MDIMSLIGSRPSLFTDDVRIRESELRSLISTSSFLVIGAAGSIGQAVVKEIFKRDPKKLHAVDISENNLVELVRDLRSSIGYGTGEFATFALDCGGLEFSALMSHAQGYDYILNLSALKHVRSESDPFTLMRLIRTNIENSSKTLNYAKSLKSKKYFCVSTDKAANPVNMMGASKRIMEKVMLLGAEGQDISMARFANVAFSDGSLLHGFTQRILKRQPLSAPNDVRRYFVTPQESGELCLMSTLFGGANEIFFPKLSEHLHLTKFSDIAVRFLQQQGYQAYECSDEDEARSRVDELTSRGQWPCYFFESDTTGEKDFEEFYTDAELVDWHRYDSIGVIANDVGGNDEQVSMFLEGIDELIKRGAWSKQELISLFNLVLPNFNHLETGKYLDGKM